MMTTLEKSAKEEQVRILRTTSRPIHLHLRLSNETFKRYFFPLQFF